MIRFVFKETDIEIHVYSLTEIKHAEIQEIIAEHHSSLLGGHRGKNQTFKRIQAQFHREGLEYDLKECI